MKFQKKFRPPQVKCPAETIETNDNDGRAPKAELNRRRGPENALRLLRMRGVSFVGGEEKK